MNCGVPMCQLYPVFSNKLSAEIKRLRSQVERLEAIAEQAYEEGVEDGIDWQIDSCGEPRPQWIDTHARIAVLTARTALETPDD